MYLPGYTVMIRLIAFRKCNFSAYPYFVAFLLKSFENVLLVAPSLCVHIIKGAQKSAEEKLEVMSGESKLV
jgi:hypothetical protein